MSLYTTCNEVAALHEEMNEVVAVLRGGTTRLGEAFLGFSSYSFYTANRDRHQLMSPVPSEDIDRE